MQPHLTRSTTNRMIGGVCGGLAQYFAIDPVIVRIIFILVTLTSGLGIVIYPVLWLVMPKGVAPNQQSAFPQASAEWRRRVEEVGQEAAEIGQSVEREVREVFGQGRSSGAPPTTYAPGADEGFKYDPYTGQPLSRPADNRPAQKRAKWIGFALLGLGVIIAANMLGLPTDILMPVFLIGAGIVLLMRKS